MIKTLILNTFRYLAIVTVALILSYGLSNFTWNLYSSVTLETGGSWINLGPAVGMILNYIFFLPIVLVAFGDRYKYFVAGFLFLPFGLYEFSSEFQYIAQDTMILVAGFVFGFALRHIIEMVPTFKAWGKYF